MLVYTYDGSFEGLLTAIFEAYYRHEKPQKLVCRKNLQQSFNCTFEHIETDEEKSSRVYKSISSKISRGALENAYHVFLSNIDEPGTVIYRYLKFGWTVGRSIDRHMTDERVYMVHRMSRRVKLEKHRMLGFVRFKLLKGGIYYASIEPDHNITELLAPHFAARLSDQNWIIHDIRRKLAVVYNKKEWVIVQADEQPVIGESADEQKFTRLWKDFFETIAVKGRINPKLQKNFMPVRYWKHLTEKQT
jgi:probable DNA metabolism protein